MNMKRRTFLKLLGLAPAIPIANKLIPQVRAQTKSITTKVVRPQSKIQVNDDIIRVIEYKLTKDNNIQEHMSITSQKFHFDGIITKTVQFSSHDITLLKLDICNVLLDEVRKVKLMSVTITQCCSTNYIIIECSGVIL